MNTKFLLPVLNGLYGDKLVSRKPDWAIPMSFRVDGDNVSVSGLKPHIRGKNFIVLVHGLMADENIWRTLRKGFPKNKTVLSIRYNTGLHISENGKFLAGLIEALLGAYKVKNLFIVGHSMGGLVTRSACYAGELEGHSWLKKLKGVFLIAVPNAGAALEKIGHLTSISLRFIDRWYLGHAGNLLEQRSDGIKDLRLGSMLEEDWKLQKSKIQDHFKRKAVPPIAGVQYHILIGSLSKNKDSLLAKYFGDGLVTPGSAAAETLLKVSSIKMFPGTGHNALVRHPEVISYVASHT